MEAAVQEALSYIQKYPNAKVATVARLYGVTRGKLRRRLAGHGGPNRPIQHNRRLNRSEEEALCSYIACHYRLNLSLDAKLVEAAANSILRAKAPPNQPAPVVGSSWVWRFTRRHQLQMQKQKQKRIEHKDEQFKKTAQRAFEETAKIARSWRLSGRLQPAIVSDHRGGVRLLKRF